MRIRKQDSNGDYVFGHNAQDFFVNTPEGVGQAVLTGLQLLKGNFFADTSAGVDYLGSVVGRNTASLYDQIIRNQILSTFGVQSIVSYTSVLDSLGRNLNVNVSIATIFDTVINVAVSVPITTGGYGAGPYGSNPGYGE